MNSARFFTGRLAGTTSTLLVWATYTTGTKSRSTLYGIFGLMMGPIECVLPVAISKV